ALAETLALRGASRPELAQEYASRIAAEAERLTDLLSDLLDLSAIESGRKEYHPEPVAAREVLDEVTRRYSEAAGRKGTRLEMSADPQVMAWVDSGSVTQALANLVDNAIKY